MPIALARGENIRLYRSFEIEPHPKLNLIVGGNAAGKTSLLEALYVPARGRSFRTSSLLDLAGPAARAWSAFLQEGESGALGARIGFGWSPEGGRLRFNDRDAPLTDAIRAVPMQLIDPSAHRLVEEGPTYRRSYVDWGVFHVEHRFHDVWRKFQRALKQRNRALRDRATPEVLDAWIEDLASTADAMTEMRRHHVAEVRPRLERWAKRLLDAGEISCEWLRGWSADSEYRDVLIQHRDQHQRMGTTVQGPHRGELKIGLGGQRAKERLSRGQQKLLVTAMVLAQAELMIEKGVPPPTLLVDDFAAELSEEFQARAAAALEEYAGQVFVTAFAPPRAFQHSALSRFHVEQGVLRPASLLH